MNRLVEDWLYPVERHGLPAKRLQPTPLVAHDA
jgi:hypothetical protein